MTQADDEKDWIQVRERAKKAAQRLNNLEHKGIGSYDDVQALIDYYYHTSRVIRQAQDD